MSLVSIAGRRLSSRLVLALVLLPATTAAGPAEPPSAATEAEASAPLPEVREVLTVTDTRLRDRPEERRRVAAHVTVIGEEEIASSAADTLQELLAGTAGVVSYDQAGNDLSRVLDLRGFTGGGVKVFLDGVPLNEPRNNSLQLELVPLRSLGRVEITRGSTAALAGGGSEAGVINLWTRRSVGQGGRLSAAGGELSTTDLGAAAWSGGERGDLLVSASRLHTDGHRDNGASELRRLAAIGGWTLGTERRLQLSVLYGEGDFGNPGALNGPELAADRRQAPFNELDFTEESSLQAVLGFEGAVGDGWSLSANLYRRERSAEVLTTGRSAPAFGGFFTDSETSLSGATAQASRAGGTDHDLSLGVELLDGETGAAGFSTPPTDLDGIDRAFPSSDNLATRRTAAVYLQDSWRPAAAWTLTGGLRYDDDEVGYEEGLPDPANRASRTFSELSLRLGAVWAPGELWELYLSYGEAFLPPTVEELFSFPLFGSNPELEPEDASSFELGLRRRWRRAALEAALFRIDTVDEIVFDPNSPLSPFGANVNAGETRREGVELVASGRASRSLRLHATLTLTEAEFTRGDHRSRTVPLVPEQRLTLGVDVALPRGLALSGRALAVGEQVLANDDANTQPPLDGYTVIDARLTWEVREAGVGPRLFVEANNLFDERYSTRGIYAFDFSTLRNDVFFSPAPGRRVLAGVEWGF